MERLLATNFSKISAANFRRQLDHRRSSRSNPVADIERCG
jgi:hypothetical protein